MSKLTVLIPVYNAEKYISESLKSILNQTYKDFDVLVIDDCSTDTTLKIIKAIGDSRVKVIQNKQNLGVTKTLNIGLKLTESEYIARHDADDIAHPKKLERQMDYLRENPEIACLGCQLNIINENNESVGKWIYPKSHDAIRWKLIFNSAIAHPSVIFKRQAVLDVGGYNENIECAQDFDLWSRLADTNKLSNLDETLIDYRIHSSSISVSKKSKQLDTRKAISKINVNKLEPDLKNFDFIDNNFDNYQSLCDYSEKIIKLQSVTLEQSSYSSRKEINLITQDIIVNHFMPLSFYDSVAFLLNRPCHVTAPFLKVLVKKLFSIV